MKANPRRHCDPINAVIASVAKQSVTINASWVTDCFVAALLAMTGKGNAMIALWRNLISNLILLTEQPLNYEL
jgi:hypothetical protein